MTGATAGQRDMAGGFAYPSCGCHKCRSDRHQDLLSCQGCQGMETSQILFGASPDAERALRERLSARTENNSSSTTSRRLLEDELEIRGSLRSAIVDLITTWHSTASRVVHRESDRARDPAHD